MLFKYRIYSLKLSTGLRTIMIIMTVWKGKFNILTGLFLNIRTMSVAHPCWNVHWYTEVLIVCCKLHEINWKYNKKNNKYQFVESPLIEQHYRFYYNYSELHFLPLYLFDILTCHWSWLFCIVSRLRQELTHALDQVEEKNGLSETLKLELSVYDKMARSESRGKKLVRSLGLLVMLVGSHGSPYPVLPPSYGVHFVKRILWFQQIFL